jgi:nicotinate-nucleotide adenylyltransferase
MAIYESQFDPIHYGNLLFAEWVRQEYGHDRVLFVPSASPPNNRAVKASAEARHRMVVAATAENPFFDSSRIALDRNTVSYALLSVEDVHRQYGAHVELDLIISSKFLSPSNQWYLPTWMGAEELFKKVRFLVFPEDMADVEQIRALAKKIPEAKIEVVSAPTLPVTSQEISEHVRTGRSIRYMTPWVVQQTITKQDLYRRKTSKKA